MNNNDVDLTVVLNLRQALTELLIMSSGPAADHGPEANTPAPVRLVFSLIPLNYYLNYVYACLCTFVETSCSG